MNTVNLRSPTTARVLRRLPSPSLDGPRPLVVIVDDDDDIREALHELLQSVGLDAISFRLDAGVAGGRPAGRPGCLILDVRMPGSSGLDLQATCRQRQCEAGHLSHRPWRHPDDGPGNEGRRGRLPHQAGAGPDAARCRRPPPSKRISPRGPKHGS